MATTTIRELITKLGVEADADKVKDFDSALSTAKNTMKAAAAAAAALAAAIIGVTVATAAYGDAAAKGATSTGLNVEAYQELQFAAEKAGLSQSQFESALQMQARAAETAAESNEGYIETANGTRIAVKNANGEMKTQEELLTDTAKAVAAATTEQEKLAIATAVYGRSGAELLPLLEAGEEGIDALRQQAVELGYVMSEEATEASEAFNDSLTDLKAIATGLRNDIGEALLPVMTEAVEKFRDWYLANKEVIAQRLDLYVGYIVSGIEWLVSAAEILNSIVQATFGSWLPVIVAIIGAVSALVALFALPTIISALSSIAAGISAVASIGLPVIAAVVAIVATLIGYFVALGLVLQDVWTYFQGGDSVVGRLIDRFPILQETIDALKNLFVELMPLLSELWTLVQTFGEIWWFVFSNTTLPVLTTFAEMLMFVAGILGAVFLENIKNTVNAVTTLVQWLTTALEILNSFVAAIGSADSAAAALSGVVGGLFGGTAEAGASGLFAPTTAAAAEGGGTTTASTSIGGNTYNISGVGLTADETQHMIDAAEEERNRTAAEVSAGSEV